MVVHKSIKQKRQAREARAAQYASIADRNAQIVKLRKLGMALEDIGNKFGVSKERVRQILESYNLSVPEKDRIPDMVVRRTPSVVEERKATVKALLDEGLSTDKIIEKLRISGAMMAQTLVLLRKEGNLIPKNGNQGKIDINVARRMRAAGATLKTIATRFGVTIPSVQQLLEKHKQPLFDD